MKLECSLVEDLYPLYEENELRPENRLAVEEHLQHCTKCSELYKSGTGFSELPPPEEKLSKEMDGRIRLHFKLRRMKVIAALLATVIIVSGINQYAANREKVANLLNGVYLYAESLNKIAQNLYEIDSSGDILSYAAEDVVDVDDELLWFERKRNGPLLVNSQELDEMAVTLRERKSQGLEDETDIKAIELLQKYTNMVYKHVQKEYSEFHHGYSSYFEFLDIEGIGTPIGKINELAFFYNKYHKLPSEMELIKEKELKQTIRTAFNAKDGKVELKREDFGVYRFDLQDGETKMDGEIDGYTGLILSVHHYGQQLNVKKPLDKEVVKVRAEEILKAIYGEAATFELKDELGGEPNTYRFRFTPLVGKYKLYFPLGEPFVLELDAGTGEFYSLSAQPALQSKEFFSKNYQVKQTQASLEKKAEQILGGKVKSVATGVIYSTVAADYVLVQIFEREKSRRTYLNAETGGVERPYLLNLH
ncbi:zf-HC2 domain-containing protein [Neobacillus sp. DY30]|uniref:zf-HC2 domain-containing protein n=1 Tax=Neobacillus sp. DY30 TaxID=3047871 RepID=UPI0024C02033|nr:zf-HC2 domain-containing protein [Neobacillus sp. DY30]WHY00468.1 zf-HC2 domain-containing protein [Neobacillus sp. DY30]